MELNYFYLEKPKGKFIALYADGSGAQVFWRLDDENGLPVYCDHEGDLISEAETWFEDSGFLYWIPLPDDFKLWFEMSYL